MKIRYFYVCVLCFIIFSNNSKAQNAQAKCDSAFAHQIVLPYFSSNDSTCHLGDDFEDTNTVACGNTTYLSGEDRLYAFTALTSGNIQINVNTTTTYVGIFAFVGCPTSGTCAGTQTGITGQENLTFYAIAGITYYIIIDTWDPPSCIPSYNIYIGPATGPTVQDCAGAIPITTCHYVQDSVYTGTGNVLNEIDTANCCLKAGEENDVWYTFTVYQSGDLNFTLTPFDFYNDYNWAVFNLTNKSCDSIFSDSSMLVSCNMAGHPNSTGANGMGTTNSEGLLGSQYNAVIPVLAGETYAIIVNYFPNLNVTQTGYTLDFCSSTAILFDSIPPQFSSVNTNINCISDTIRINFDKKIKCNSIQLSDFALTGPAGTYTLLSMSSTCDNNAIGDSSFLLTVSPPVNRNGIYNLYINGNIFDLSNYELVTPVDYSFYFPGMIATTDSITNASCTQSNGAAYETVSNGSGSYIYSWTPIASNSYSITGVPSGVYTFSVYDAATGCTLDTNVSIGNVDTLSALLIDSSVTCFGGNNGSALVLTSGGSGNYSYFWSPSGNTTASITNQIAGAYTIIVSDTNGCSYTIIDSIIQPSQLIANAGVNDTICFGYSFTLGTIYPAHGGNAPYKFLWSPTTALSDSTNPNPSANPVTTTTYLLTVTDSNGCTASSSVTIKVNPLPPTPIITLNGNILSSTLAVGYQWYLNENIISGATSQTYPLNQFGAYTVQITDSNGCKSTSLPFGYVGIPDVDNSQLPLSIFPNPNTGRFEISLNLIAVQHFNIGVYNISGQNVYSENKTITAGKYSESFDFSGLAKGIYVLRMTSEQFTSNRKIVIE
jgi:type IX secretion system substrate protein/SprB-like repeat protein